MRLNTPTRKLRPKPDLNQLKRQAKELLAAYLAGEAQATEEVNAHYRDAGPANFALHDAQLVLARSYGFRSWPKLKAFVDGLTLDRFVAAVQANDLALVRRMLKARPELATLGKDNYAVLHYAVLNQAPEMVRLLMQHGANARDGIYPHRDATSSLTIARERGYAEIVAIIEAEELRRREAKTGVAGAPEPDAFFKAIGTSSNEAMAMLQAAPELIRTCNAQGWTALHVAARGFNDAILHRLLDRGADVAARDNEERTALDMAAIVWWGPNIAERFAPVAKILLERGAPMTARAAAALGDVDWLRARHAEGRLDNPIEDSGGLLRIAVSHGRPAVLEFLLDAGFDPDERLSFGEGDEVSHSWGMPLHNCAGSGQYAMAELLLKRGADPNGRVMASGDPVFQAYSRRDWKMADLLARYGGKVNATTAGLFRQTDLARKMLAGEAPYLLDGVGGDTLAEQLVWGAACGGDPEILRLALPQVAWPRDDLRWFYILEQPLRIWNHGSPQGDNPEWDRGTYVTCFKLLLERCDPNIRGRVGDKGQFGLTILHSVMGSRDHVLPAERLAFTNLLLAAGARLDLRDNMLRSTPLGWACRWGRADLAKVLLEHGADTQEPEAEPWATPRAWAEKMGHHAVRELLRGS